MRSYLYPAFTMEPDEFERALPAAVKFSQTYHIPCRVLKQGDLYTLCFEDKAVAKGIVYGHRYEVEMDRTFRKYAIEDVVYLKKEEFEKGCLCNQ